MMSVDVDINGVVMAMFGPKACFTLSHNHGTHFTALGRELNVIISRAQPVIFDTFPSYVPAISSCLRASNKC